MLLHRRGLECGLEGVGEGPVPLAAWGRGESTETKKPWTKNPYICKFCSSVSDRLNLKDFFKRLTGPRTDLASNWECQLESMPNHVT